MILPERSRKGSVTVFVCLFFLSMTAMLLAFIDASRKTAVNSSAEALCSLWAESVLAEYDLNLQKRYNIFGFYGYPKDVTEKLDYYAEGSFKDKKYIRYGGSSCSLYDYALTDVDIFSRQLVEAGKLAFTEKFIRPEKEVVRVEHAGEPDEETEARRNLFDDLPSAGSGKGYSASAVKDAVSGLTSLGDVVKAGSDSYFIEQYIFSYFKDAGDDKNLGETYFSQEIEYIICGRKSDRANQRSIRGKIVALREGTNFLCISRSPDMRARTMAAAELLTPGPAAAVTEKALMAAWALAESVNDYKLLIAGHSVPLVKTERLWATNLDSVIANKEEGCIFTGIDEGEDYSDYLRLFTYTMDSRVRALRIMDLIQINMRYLYYDSFLLREYNGGVRFSMKVNGVEHEVVKKY